jgi:Na+/H+ antiporter NhaD/arsenite permease-like protein
LHIAVVLFGLTYLLISLGENSPRKLDRPTAALLGAVLMVLTGVLTRAEAAAAIDFSTLALLFGMMVLLSVLTRGGLPTFLALQAVARCRGPRRLLGVVVFSSGIASALLLNDTVCLLGTPLILQVTTAAGLPAAPYLIALATSSNIGSVMTLTGNPQNMLIGGASGWGWSAFALRMIPIGLVCLAVNWGLLSLLYGRELPKSSDGWTPPAATRPKLNRKLAFRSGLVFVGLVAAFILGAPMDLAAVSAATILLVWINRPPREALEAEGGVDWSLLLFFAGLFVVVAGLVKEERGLLDASLGHLDRTLSPLGTVQLTLLTLLGSNLFSNVPYVLIVEHWVRKTTQPEFAWLLLALTSTFAGNLTLFGSVANLIVAQGALGQTPLGFGAFLRAGVPVTLVTTTVGVGLLWLLHIAGR